MIEFEESFFNYMYSNYKICFEIKYIMKVSKKQHLQSISNLGNYLFTIGKNRFYNSK